MAGTIALVGSGEYLLSMEPLEQKLIEQGVANGKKPKFVQLATAAGQEGYASLQRWRELGQAQADRIGVEAVFVEAYEKADTLNHALCQQIEDAALIYLSGGNPIYLTDTLRGSPLFETIWQNWRSGSSLAGCSAGAMALSAEVANPFKLTAAATPGLNVAERLKVLPHFDRYFGWIPKPMAKFLGRTSSEILPIGIDENTALVSTGESRVWEVWGYGKATVLTKHDHSLLPGELLRVDDELINPE
ncbi:MAG: Type 1 glutamine amidotransferase-like domain-containing protein [Candidatus Nanopelagicales bacterium]|jgi:cyanophycinase-like exopeptidase